jgi:hypothetical protein
LAFDNFLKVFSASSKPDKKITLQQF